nr:DUF2096 family protein [Methanococcus vannielii]
MKDAKGIDKQWVVLNELASKLSIGRPLPEEVYSKLRISNNILTYYLLDEHANFEVLRDAEKEISRLQAILFGICDSKMAKEYIDKMGKALRGELNVEFPLKTSSFNVEVKRKKDSETIRVNMPINIHVEILGEFSEYTGVIFEWSQEEDGKVLIEGPKDRVVNALKDFSSLWKSF